MKDVTCHLEPNTHFATRERRENSLPPPPWNPKLLAPLAHRRPTLFLVNVTLISTQSPLPQRPWLHLHLHNNTLNPRPLYDREVN